MRRWKRALAAGAAAAAIAVVPGCGDDAEEATLPEDVQQQIDEAQEQGRDIQEDIQDDVDEQLEQSDEQLEESEQQLEEQQQELEGERRPGRRVSGRPGQRPASARARTNTSSSMRSVSLPVNVFCWLGW